MSREMELIDLGSDVCLRCRVEITRQTGMVSMCVMPQRLTWSLCQDCWNELVLMDSASREVEVLAVNDKLEQTKVRGW